MRKNLIWVGAKLQEEAANSRTHRWRCAFGTLTYADSGGWAERDISRYFHKLKKWLARRGVPMRLFWVCEMQTKRSVPTPHYHFALWLPQIGVGHPDADARGWLRIPKPDASGMWPHGHSQIAWVKRSAVGYMLKYASKLGSKDGLPKGARVFGYCGLTRSAARQFRYFRAPWWLREKLQNDDADVRRLADGAWLWVQGQVVYRSPYRVLDVLGGGFVKLERVPLWCGYYDGLARDARKLLKKPPCAAERREKDLIRYRELAERWPDVFRVDQNGKLLHGPFDRG